MPRAEITFEPTPRERAEPHIRLWHRNGEFRKLRWRATLFSAVLAAVIIGLIDSAFESGFNWIGALAVGLLAGGFSFARYRRYLIKHTKNSLKRQLKHHVDHATTVTIEDDSFISRSCGAEVRLPLSELTELSEDPEYVEIAFGSKSLCTIPQRAFASEDAKRDFLNTLRGVAKECG
ncbi:MAG: hypothetical protein ACFB21_02915 [Opitutales bacterium]